MHEQSVTIERGGKFYNLSGVDGRLLEGPFDTLAAAVKSAKQRSASFDEQGKTKAILSGE